MKLQGVAHVQVFMVFAPPVKGVAALALEALKVDTPAPEELDVLLGKILPDDADDPHGREEAGAHGEIGRRAAENALGRARRSLDRIERDGADYEYAHLMYFPMIGFRSRAVFFGIFFRSVIIAFSR